MEPKGTWERYLHLPVELWIEILHYLDFDSVINLSVVCKNSYEATKAGSIWKRLCAQWRYPEKPQTYETWRSFFKAEVYLNRPIPLVNKISSYNNDYFCTITKIVFSPTHLTIHIDERGNYSLGAIQDPRASKLNAKWISFPLVGSEFQVADKTRQLLGV